MALTDALHAEPTGARARFDADRQVLVGSRCTSCGACAWPPRAVCHRCGDGRVEEIDLPKRGRLLTYTTVWVPRPGLETPYVLGQVDLDGRVVVFAHVRGLTDGVKVPLPVTVEVSRTPGNVPPFWFVLASGKED